jgi:hypothetical protein
VCCYSGAGGVQRERLFIGMNTWLQEGAEEGQPAEDREAEKTELQQDLKVVQVRTYEPVSEPEVEPMVNGSIT